MKETEAEAGLCIVPDEAGLEGDDVVEVASRRRRRSRMLCNASLEVDTLYVGYVSVSVIKYRARVSYNELLSAALVVLLFCLAG